MPLSLFKPTILILTDPHQCRKILFVYTPIFSLLFSQLNTIAITIPNIDDATTLIIAVFTEIIVKFSTL